MHAHLSLGARSDLFDFFDDFREFSGANTVLGDDVSNPVSVVILLALFGVGTWRGAPFAVKKNLAAVVACCFQGGFDQVDEPDVDNGEFELDVTKVPGGILVLTVVRRA